MEKFFLEKLGLEVIIVLHIVFIRLVRTHNYDYNHKKIFTASKILKRTLLQFD